MLADFPGTIFFASFSLDEQPEPVLFPGSYQEYSEDSEGIANEKERITVVGEDWIDI